MEDVFKQEESENLNIDNCKKSKTVKENAEIVFADIEAIKLAILNNYTTKAALNYLGLKDSKPARKLFKEFIKTHKCSIEHFKHRLLVKPDDFLDIKEIIEKFKTKELLSTAEETLLKEFTSLFTLYLCCGRISVHGSGYRIYLSFPERNKKSIAETQRILQAIFPHRKVGFNITHSTKDSNKRWCELNVYDNSLKDIIGIVNKGYKNKSTEILLEEWQLDLIEKFSLDALKGFLIFSNISANDKQIFYRFIHRTPHIMKLVEKACLVNDIDFHSDKTCLEIKDLDKVHLLNLFINNYCSSSELKKVLSEGDMSNTLKQLLDTSVKEYSNKDMLYDVTSNNKNYIEKPVLDTKYKKAIYSKLLGLYLGDGYIDKLKDKNVYRLRIYLDNAYPQVIDEAIKCCEVIFSDNKIGCLDKSKQKGKGKSNCSEVMVYSQYLLELFPQHGPGKKHERDIILEDWQEDIIKLFPLEFFQGLYLSDGCSFIIPANKTHKKYIRYKFTNVSEDIKQLFRDTCDRLYAPYCNNSKNKKDVTIQKQKAVAFLHPHVGFKYDLTLSSSEEYFADVKEKFNIEYGQIPKDFSIDRHFYVKDNKIISGTCKCGARKYKEFGACKPCGIEQGLIITHNCLICKKGFYSTKSVSKFCSQECSHKNQERAERPSKEELAELVWEKPVMNIAEEYGVSGSAVKKWCKALGVDTPGVGYWAKRKAESETNVLPVSKSEFAELVNSGITVEGLAKHFKVDTSKINHWLALNNLRTKGQIRYNIVPKLKEY